MHPTSTCPQPEVGRYEIRTQGHLDARWAAWFDDLGLTRDPDGTTVLCVGTEVRAFCVLRDASNPASIQAIPVPEHILQLCQ